MGVRLRMMPTAMNSENTEKAEELELQLFPVYFVRACTKHAGMATTRCGRQQDSISIKFFSGLSCSIPSANSRCKPAWHGCRGFRKVVGEEPRLARILRLIPGVRISRAPTSVAIEGSNHRLEYVRCLALGRVEDYRPFLQINGLGCSNSRVVKKECEGG